MTITHESNPPGFPLRLCTDVEPVTSNTQIFTPFPIQTAVPGSVGGRGGVARIAFDSVDETVRLALRQLNPSPKIQLDLVLLSDPDTIIRTSGQFRLFNTQIDPVVISSDLDYDNAFREAYSARRFNPSTAPGIF